MKPSIYLNHGKWTCALQSGGWTIFPYGKGNTPFAAYKDWLLMRAALQPTTPIELVYPYRNETVGLIWMNIQQ